MALYLAKELNIPILVGTGNVETGFVGGGASNIKNLFAKSNMIASLFEKKCIIFLDEAQILFKKRNNLNGNKWEDDSTNELLSYLDGVNTKNQNKIIFIAASNFDENNMNFDSAIERRFQKKIYFRNPNKKEREEIFKFYLEQNKINIQNIDINYLSEITSNLSPGKIEIIVKETLIYKNFEIEKITTEDLIKNFEILTVGHTTKEITKEKEEERELIIKHELGHFFCYYQLLSQKYNYDKKKIIENLKILKISSESIARQNALGYVLNVQKDINLKSLNELEEEIICLYGGVASEEVFYGKDKITVGSFNDIEKITEILNTIVNKLNMYSNYKINYNNLLKEQQKDNLIVIEKKSELLFNKSKEIIQQNKNKIEKLSIILKENWIIDKNQIIDLINKGTI